jgi:hypothetical protein
MISRAWEPRIRALPARVDVLVATTLCGGHGTHDEAAADQVKAGEAAGVVKERAEPFVIIVVA